MITSAWFLTRARIWKKIFGSCVMKIAGAKAWKDFNLSLNSGRSAAITKESVHPWEWPGNNKNIKYKLNAVFF